MGRIIVIEDNPVFRDHVCGMLEKAGYKTHTAYDCAGARRLLEELDNGDIIVSDLRLPDGECTEVLERMREAGIRNPFVIMTDYAQVASAVSSMRLGAEDYIPKTLLQEKLLPRIRELVRKTERRHTMPILERRSVAFRTIDRRISLVAPTDIGVLILGENGTGKEHVAEKIHAQSTRQKGPFVAIDCGMLTRELAASELFGYEKGAFTGAITGKKGCMAEADGGTLFLDEVGNLPAEVQQKLLRALQTKCYRGGRTFPAGPVSPPEGICHQDTAAAGMPGGHTAPCGVFPGACQRGTGTAYGRIRQGGGKGTHEADVGKM